MRLFIICAAYIIIEITIKMVLGLAFNLISIFILGTPNNYWSRMVPISNTWGQHFEHLYFAMARGPKWKKMKKRCKKIEKFEELEHYVCQPQDSVPPEDIISPQKNSLSLLYAAKCPDKYFGYSPTCKLEVVMLYFL